MARRYLILLLSAATINADVRPKKDAFAHVHDHIKKYINITATECEELTKKEGKKLPKLAQDFFKTNEFAKEITKIRNQNTGEYSLKAIELKKNLEKDCKEKTTAIEKDIIKYSKRERTGYNLAALSTLITIAGISALIGKPKDGLTNKERSMTGATILLAIGSAVYGYYNGKQIEPLLKQLDQTIGVKYTIINALQDDETTNTHHHHHGTI